MKILFFGDIVGKAGRIALAKKLPKLKKELKPNLVIANAENIAHGTGITEKTILEMRAAGIDYFTTGNHILDNKQGVEYLKKNTNAPVIIPANLEAACPGNLWKIVKIKNTKVLIINLLGQVFVKEKSSSPFFMADAILKETKKYKPKIIILDIHAEATSEKQALWYYLDGKISAIVGTHTHVATANPRISQKGTALVEDIGMVGSSAGILGDNIENVIKRFLTDKKFPLHPQETGPVIINAVLIDIDEKTGKASKIKRIDQTTSV